MRTAIDSPTPRGGHAAGMKTLRAPIKGWIANENIAAIPDEGAYLMDNWIPESNHIRIRPGHSEHADMSDTSTVSIATLMVHNAGGTRTLFAAQDEFIWDVTSGTPMSSDLSSLTSDRWISTNFTTTGGNFLFIVNAADSARHYNGTSWATPSITGTNSNTFSYVWAFANRLFFIIEDSATIAYLPVDSVAGAATTFEVGGELALGGTLVAGAALTHDAGDGPEDYCVLISSEGEVIIYQGTDPDNADTWAKKGRFRIGRPVGSRCVLQIGGDIAVITQDGVVSLARSILLDRAAARRGAFTESIRTAFADQYALTGSTDGWEIHSWPAGHLAIVNVPIVADTTFHQYVMNVLTGAWCRWKGMDATTWVLSGDTMYFGTTGGKVMEFADAGADDADAVDAVCIGAYSDYDRPGLIKHVKGAHAYARTDGQVTLGLNMTPNFETQESAASSRAFGAASGAVWDTAVWDTAVWAEGNVVDAVWLGVAAAGKFIAPVIVSQVAGDETDSTVVVEFYAMEVIHETGAILG